MKKIIKKIVLKYKETLNIIKEANLNKYLSIVLFIMFVTVFLYENYVYLEEVEKVNFSEDIKNAENLKEKYGKINYNQIVVDSSNNKDDNTNEETNYSEEGEGKENNGEEKTLDNKEESYSKDEESTKIDFNNIEYVIYNNDRFNFSAEYPSFLEKQESSWPLNVHGSQFLSKENEICLNFSGYNNALAESTEQMYNDEKKGIEGISYEALFDNSFVLSWEKDGRIFYKYTVVGTGSYDSFTINYEKDLEEELNAIIEHIYKSFKAEHTDEVY